MTNPFGLLRDKKILAILDGDTELGEEIKSSNIKGNIKNSLPYLSGPQLCELSNRSKERALTKGFGLAVSYGWGSGTQSRWSYLDDLLAYCIKNSRASDLLAYLFSKEQFADKLGGYTPEEIDQAYNTIIGSAIKSINGFLMFGGNELVNAGNGYVVQKIGAIPKVAAPAMKIINRKYISDLAGRAMEDVEKCHFDSAITKCRTLLEEVFCYVIEKKGETPSDSGDIGKLYSQVKDLYQMHSDKAMDKRINMLLSGLEKILKSITEMRNETSDSHGVGARRINIAEHHARLFVNSSMTMADFILAVGERQ